MSAFISTVLRDPVIYADDYPLVLLSLSKQVADAANCLDALKDSATSKTMRDEADQCSANLHVIAQQLAGERVSEVYGEQEEEPHYETT